MPIQGDGPVGKYERLRRLEQALMVSGSAGARPAELALEMGVCRQTVYRDLKVLEAEGVPLYNPSGGRWAVRQEAYVGTVRLDLHQAVALFFAARLLARMADEHNPHAVTALKTLALRFPQPVQQQAMAAAEQLAHRPRNPEFVKALEVLTVGWIERRKVQLSYQGAKGRHRRPYLLHPYFLEPVGASLGAYVLGYEESYFRDILVLKVERMSGARLLNERFPEPAGFDPVQALQSAWGIMWSKDPVTVRLRFAADVTRRVKESRWHASQVIEDLPDGGCILTLCVGHTLELKPWIRSWGAAVEVLEPAGLRAEVAEEARVTAALYARQSVPVAAG